MERTELPIAVFDSGLGGISVLRALVQRLPGEDFLYFGDSANAPYGVRPVAEVRRLTQDVIGRLYDRGIKAAVIACNTATSAAIGPLRAAFPDIPVIGIEPALKPAVAHHRRVLVLATPLTLREEKFVALMHQCAGCAEIVPLPCPELVEFVERGELDSPALTAYLARQLGPYAGRVDAAVLGCTHFPFARRAIRAALGGWLLAQLKLMGVTFLILTAGFLLLRTEYPLLFALLTTLIDALPVFGTGTVLIPWALLEFLHGNTACGVGFLILYAVAALTRQTLEPRLVGQQIGLAPIFTLLALYAGYKTIGVPGMILFPICAVLFRQLWDHSGLQNS